MKTFSGIWYMLYTDGVFWIFINKKIVTKLYSPGICKVDVHWSFTVMLIGMKATVTAVQMLCHESNSYHKTYI